MGHHNNIIVYKTLKCLVLQIVLLQSDEDTAVLSGGVRWYLLVCGTSVCVRCYVVRVVDDIGDQCNNDN